MNRLQTSSVLGKYEDDVISFTQQLVQIKSYSDQEEQIAKFIVAKMKELDFDDVFIDSLGNVVGRIGNGEKVIMFDSHMDTVEVQDETKWIAPPFSGEIVDGKLYGRGSVDMKSSIASSIYAAKAAKELGFDKGKTIYVSCTVNEEYCDGENLKHLFKECNIKPDYMVICEPSDNKIALGHNGKAQVIIKTKGISAHGAAPEKGKNAIYEMAEIIQRVEKQNEFLQSENGTKGTLVMSNISSVSASLNAVPFECEVYLDRRMALGETKEMIEKEMDALIKGKNARWEIGTLQRTSWTGKEITYKPFHIAWKIEKDHGLTKACIQSYEEVFGKEPSEFEYWDFSTNAVTPVSIGIPTIGFGPGEQKLAHMDNEHCTVRNIIDAMHFYTTVMKNV